MLAIYLYSTSISLTYYNLLCLQDQLCFLFFDSYYQSCYYSTFYVFRDLEPYQLLGVRPSSCYNPIFLNQVVQRLGSVSCLQYSTCYILLLRQVVFLQVYAYTMPLSSIEAVFSCLFIGLSSMPILKVLKALGNLTVPNKRLTVVELAFLAYTSVYQAVRLLQLCYTYVQWCYLFPIPQSLP